MKVVKGDLLKLAENGQFDVIIHGCNCFHTMGAGIARQISVKYPEAFEADLFTLKGSREKLGMFSTALIQYRVQFPFVIINAYTQFDYNASKKPVDYSAIREAFRKIKQIFGNCRIGYPMIGAGLAGGDWSIISTIIDEELEGCNHTLVEYQP